MKPLNRCSTDSPSPPIGSGPVPMGGMVIVCPNHDRFMDVIESLVRKGLTFSANHDGLSVKLTGGF